MLYSVILTKKNINFMVVVLSLSLTLSGCSRIVNSSVDHVASNYTNETSSVHAIPMPKIIIKSKIPLSVDTQQGVSLWGKYIHFLALGQTKFAWNMLSPTFQSSGYVQFEHLWALKKPYLSEYIINNPKVENITSKNFSLEFEYVSTPGTSPWYPSQRLWVDFKQINHDWLIDSIRTSP